MEALEGVAIATLGFWFYTLFTHNEKYFKHKLPKLKFKAIELSPNIKINFKKKTLWLHHWITLSAIFLALTYKVSDFSHYLFLKSFLLGGAVQGITFKDRFKIFFKSKS